MFLWGYLSDYLDPYDWFTFLWDPAQDTLRTRWMNDQYHSLVAQAAQESDPAKRLQMYRQAEVMMLKDMPVLPMTHGLYVILVQPYVQGLYYGLWKNLRWVSIAKH